MKAIFASKKLILAGVELAVLLAFAVYAIGTYQQVDIAYTTDDMELQDVNRQYSAGGYLDTSYEDKKAVVTPGFQLKKGIYYIEASYAGHGEVKAGLIYEKLICGKELVDEDEFTVNPKEDSLFYRVRIHDDPVMRFKLRLTGDAGEGDYVQLLQARITSSKLTYLCPIFCMAFFLLALDLLLYGYVKYYKAWEPQRQMVVLALVFLAFFMGLPLYRNGMSEPVNMDLRFHLQRMEGVYRGLLSGQFPVRIQPEWLNGYGYASSIFYGDIFLYFPAILRIVGFTLQDAYKCYSEAVNIAIVFVSFYSFRKMTKNDVAAMVGSMLYAGSTANLSLLYTTTMVGGYSATVFYPLVIAGFYLLFTEDVSDKEYQRNWLLLTAGFTGLLMTHIISCLIVGVYAVICCLCMLRKVFRKHTLAALMKAVCATVLLNLWFLVPFLHYMASEQLRINQELGRERTNVSYYAELGDFMGKGEGRSLYHLFLHSEYHIGYAVLIVLLLYLVTAPIQKKNKLTRHSRAFLVCTVLAFWICTDLFPIVQAARIHTVILKLFTTIQYQYRFINIAIAFAACLGAIFFAMEVWEPKAVYAAAGLLCCLTLYQDFRYFETVHTESIYLDYIDLQVMESDFGMGKGEYLPVVTDMNRLVKEIEYDEALQVGDVERNDLTFEMSVINETGQEQEILLPVLYYSGYRTTDIQSGERMRTEAGDNGRVAVTVPAGYDGTFHMAFHEPWYWQAAECVSVMTLLFVICYIIGLREKGFPAFLRKRQRQEMTDV